MQPLVLNQRYLTAASHPSDDYTAVIICIKIGHDPVVMLTLLSSRIVHRTRRALADTFA